MSSLRRAVLVRDPVGEHARAVGRLPPEDGRSAASLLVRARAQEDVRVACRSRAGSAGSSRCARTSRGSRRSSRDPEAVAQVALAVERLPDERLAAGDVAVRLDPPAADHLPAALGDPRADPLEQLRGRSPRPTRRRATESQREDEVRVLVHPVDRRLERRAHLLVALRPLPQPHRVDVRVADHVDDASAHVACRPAVDLLEDQVEQQHVHLLDARGRRRTARRARGRRASAAGPPSPPAKSTVVAPTLAGGREPARRRSASARSSRSRRRRRRRRTNARTWRAKTSSNE